MYSYDPNGNLTGTTAGQTFTYDPFNRMTQAVGAGGTATYTYNGDGLKIQRVGPDGATRYYHDGFRPIWETDGAGAMTAQLDRDIFGNLLSRREAAGIRRFSHTDGLGSTTALTDETGAVAASMLYDAWGTVRATSGTGHGKYRFTGAELDTASDLYHMGARFYDPSIGRWLSEDPLQNRIEPISLNFYAYVGNNPVILIDPTGTMPTQQDGGGSCDAACQNEQRQQAAAFAWEASGESMSEAVALYCGYLEISRVAGQRVAMRALVRAKEAASNSPMLVSSSSGFKGFVLRQLIMGLYYEALVFYGVGAVSETLALFFWDRSKLNQFVLHVAYSPLTNIGTDLFVNRVFFGPEIFQWRDFRRVPRNGEEVVPQMAYVGAVVGIALCLQGLFRIGVGMKVYIDEIRKRDPAAAMRYFGLAFVSGWGALLVGLQIVLFVFWADLPLEGTTPLWPGMMGILSLGIGFVWRIAVKRAAR